MENFIFCAVLPSGDKKHENVNLMHGLLIQHNYHLNEINLSKDLNTQI